MARSRLAWLLGCLGSLSIGCGEVAPANAGPRDAGYADGRVPEDAATFACGDAACSGLEVCLYPPYGCVNTVPEDASADGTCQPNWTLSEGLCSPPLPTPSCVVLDGGLGPVDCSGGPDAAFDCASVVTSVPSGCSRVCRLGCV
jgi:hypothetical protein